MITRFTKAALVPCLLAALAVVNAAHAAAQEASSVEVTFSGISAPTGALYIGLYDSPASFGGGKPVGGYRVEVTGATARLSIDGLKPGAYAIKVYHDIDGDGRMNTNPYGIPTEPYAASNNAPANMGPPTWADAVFEVGAQGATQAIVID